MKKLKDEKLYRLIREFLTVHLPKQRVCSDNTIKSYKKTLDTLLTFVEERKSISLFDITFEILNAQMVMDFLSWLETERNCGHATINQRLSAIRAFFDYAGKMDITLVEYQNELHKIKPKKKAVLPVEFMSESALKALLSEPDVSKKNGIRDLFYMILLYDTGARNSELLGLQLKGLELTKNCPCISVLGKGDKHRSIPIMEKTIKHCHKYLELFHCDKTNPDDYLFYTRRNGERHQMSDDNVARFLKEYGLSAREKHPEVPCRVHPHLFRHTRAMHLYQAGMPLALVSEWLGHSVVETTLIYAHADIKMKRDAINKATAESDPVNDEYDFFRVQKKDRDVLRELYGLL